MNDIEILKEMLSCAARVPLQQKGNWAFVELKDEETTVKIIKLPHNSIVIKADAFELRTVIFNGLKDERRRADFVIVSNENKKKWIICIEIKRGNINKDRVIAQLRGAKCVVDYYKSIGREFWEAKGFLEDYEYRFVGIAGLTEKQSTRPINLDNQSRIKLHDSPDSFLEILEQESLYFNELIR